MSPNEIAGTLNAPLNNTMHMLNVDKGLLGTGSNLVSSSSEGTGHLSHVYLSCTLYLVKTRLVVITI